MAGRRFNPEEITWKSVLHEESAGAKNGGMRMADRNSGIHVRVLHRLLISTDAHGSTVEGAKQ